MPSVLEIIQKTAEFFTARGVESPRLNAEHLIGHALGLKRMQLYLQFERILLEPELEKIRPLVRRRAQREPLQYILGTVEFAGVKLKTDRRALIPRPETELLVEIVVEQQTVPPARVLDLGTGTGAIALALAKAFPSAQVTAVDLSEEALALAAENVAASGFADRVTLVRSAWFAELGRDERYDVIVSNPPYLSDAEADETSPEVRQFEPRSALVAADAGLADLRTIIEAAANFLTEGGLLALETGITQHADLVRLAGERGFERVESRRDLTGRDRLLLARRRGSAN
jgi:release factor glutamine methyltransferase